MKKKSSKTIVTGLASLIVLLPFALLRSQVVPSNIHSNIAINGHYAHIFSNGAAPETNNYSFNVSITPNGWSMSVTNVSQSKEWGIMQCDGTNIYTITAVSWNGDKVYGYVYPGQFFVPEAEDAPHLFFPWMVFFLTPEMVRNRENDSLVDTPAPWGKRFSLNDYGFKWETSYFEKEKTIQEIKAVRDPSLDFKSEEDEFRRPSINYAFEYSSIDHRRETLQARKGVPAGFVRAVFECQQIYHTNDLLVPSAATFYEYWPNFQNPKGDIRLVFQMMLKVENVRIVKNEDIPDAKAPTAITTVFDYRYQATNSRTKFNCARYSLNYGEAFPSGQDPKLMAQARTWLKNGPAFQGVESKRKIILVGMLIVTFATSASLVYWLKKKTTA